MIGSGGPWPAYIAWNDALAGHYFSGRYEGVPVYLDLDPNVLSAIGKHLCSPGQEPAKTFVAVVRSTLNFAPHGPTTFARHNAAVRAWRHSERHGPPPVVGVLSFLSLVAETMRSDGRYRVTNYTDRLCDHLSVHDERQRRRLKTHFRKETHVLWDELNSWLNDHDGSVGLPTAYAFDHRVHVGVPVSQALVREHDRELIRKMFGHYSLSPGQRLPVTDMITLLDEWISHTTVSASFRRLWKNRSLRNRIAAIACVELEAWEGSTGRPPDEYSGHSIPLLWVATVRSQPLPRLLLSLLLRSSHDAPIGEYSMTDRSPVHVLPPAERPKWLRLSPPPSIPDSLVSGIRIQHEAGIVLRHDPRRIVVLKFDEDEQLYVEVFRAELNETHLILVHETILDETVLFLSSVARHGFAVHTSSYLRGVPNGWLAITNCSIIDVLDPGHHDLLPLTPLARAHVTLVGGYSLPGRSVWHVSIPPEMRIAAPYEDSIDLLIVPVQTVGEDTAPSQLVLLPATEESLSLTTLNLPEGDYRAILRRTSPTKAPRRIASASFRLRSSAYPRVPPPTSKVLHHDLIHNDHAAVSAHESLYDDHHAVRGALVPTMSSTPPSSLSSSMIAIDMWSDPSDDLQDPPAITEATTTVSACLVTGAHYWLLEAQTGGKKYIHGKCKHCGLERWHLGHARLKKELSSTRHHNHDDGNAELTTISQSLRDSRRTITFDDLLDALTFARQGSWSEYHRLAGQVNDAVWFPTESARLFSSLGHIDLALDTSTLRPKNWAIAPSTLVTHAKRRAAFLCGARWPGLLDRLRDDVAAIGGSIQSIGSEGGPSTILVGNLDLTDLQLVAESTSDAIGQELHVSHRAADRLAQQLPSLARLAQALPITSALEARVEIFDLTSGRWQSVDKPDYPGAYRFSTRPWTFAWRPPYGSGFRVGDSRVVKHLAAAAVGRTLLVYNPTDQQLLTPLGGALPGLYERAVVLCSGLSPRHSATSLCYESVTEDVADVIMAKLQTPPGPRAKETA